MEIKPEEYYYLASPYSHEHESMRYDRFIKVSRIGFKLSALGLNLFCPITQSHTLNTFALVTEKLLGHDECMRVDYAFLSRAAGLIVVKLAGWKESKGVALEIDYAMQHKMPIYMLSPDADLQHFVEVVKKADKPGSLIKMPKGWTSKDPIPDYMLDLAMSDRFKAAFKERKPSIIPGVKDSTNKDALRFVPYAAQAAIARVREHGNQKYKDPVKWYQFDDAKEKFIEAAQRHIAKYQDAVLYKNRSELDEESGLHHLDHAICTLALAIALRDKPRGESNE